MKKISVSFAIGLIVLIGSIEAFSSDAIKYSLTKGSVKNVAIHEYVKKDRKEAYVVDLTLSETSTKEFARITGANIGKRLSVVCKSAVVTEAIIQEGIDSGQIRSREYGSEAEANPIYKCIKGL
jgi:preprotein translocase subunit SecD